MMLAVLALLTVQQPSVSELAWLSGHWQTDQDMTAAGPSVTEEWWTTANFGSIAGVGRTVRHGRTVTIEFMRIARDGEQLVFYAAPDGSPPVAFRQVRMGAAEIVFENRQHDYPQRISYRREDSRLVATISLADGSRAQSWQYRLRIGE